MLRLPRPIRAGNAVAEAFNFIVVGGGSAGAVIASGLSEDPSFRLALIEAGDSPPEIFIHAGGGERWRPKDATYGSNGITKRWLLFAVPGGGVRSQAAALSRTKASAQTVMSENSQSRAVHQRIYRT